MRTTPSSRSLIGVLFLTFAVLLGSTALALSEGGGPVSFVADCELGEVRWTYTNLGDQPITLTKGRVVLAKKLDMPKDTTLVYYDRTLEPGQDFGHGVSGIIWIRDGEPQPEEDLPDGWYHLNLWFDDGVTKWRIITSIKKECS